ncbi:putative ribonuclease H-like domain-containing protein [Rosa chinensis]|uniref:Putative ribonuclease H-like domain-containing protein n=1 Tax=Rosa chinensis TaxID=74649 RepID=A0A2P6RZ68_ROSCH|nr:putative ribonuclease H-like domain-containing protein [Rosa chinensis]
MQIWKERNQRVWNSKILELDQLFFQAASGFSLFTSLCLGRSSNTKRASTAWYPPPAGWFKANLDGAFDSSTNMGGIGVVVRDSEGLIVGGTCCRVSSVSAPIVVEALAGRVACAWAVEFKHAPIIFESDCLQLVNSLKVEEEDHSIIGRVIDDIVVHLATIPSSFFQHVYRESNLDAHKLAKLALYSNVSADWKGLVPSTMGSLVASYCKTSSH